MRVEKENRKRTEPADVPYAILVKYAKTESYNSLVRKLNVNINKIKNYVEATYPTLHKQYVENALKRKIDTQGIKRNQNYLP